MWLMKNGNVPSFVMGEIIQGFWDFKSHWTHSMWLLVEKQNNSSNIESYNKTIILTEAVIFTQTIYQTTEALKCYIFFLKHKSLQNIGQLITHSLQSKKSCSKDTFKITFIISR